MSTETLEPNKIKSVTVFIFPPSIVHEIPITSDMQMTPSLWQKVKN